MARLNLGKVLVTLEGEHDSSRAYDKYCEVTSGGSSYVSKKPVPIGTLITDTAFWQLRASKGADGTDGTDGNDGADAYQPFKGWYSSTSELNTSFGTPQVGDFAYVRGATSTDPVAIYACATAGTWADSGNTFNPANNQEFASGEALNTVHIVDGLESSSATDVLSAKQGKVLDQKVAALGPKIDEAIGVDLSLEDAEELNGFISYSNGRLYVSENYKAYKFVDIGSATHIEAKVADADNGQYSIAFYSSTEISDSTIIANDSVRSSNTNPREISADIPSGCKMVVVTNKNSIYPTPSVSITREGTVASKQDLAELTQEIEETNGNVASAQESITALERKFEDSTLDISSATKISGYISKNGRKYESVNYDIYLFSDITGSYEIEVSVADSDKDQAAIAFYSSTGIDQNSLIKYAPSQNANPFSVTESVPAGCKLIAVTNKKVNANPTAYVRFHRAVATTEDISAIDTSIDVLKNEFDANEIPLSQTNGKSNMALMSFRDSGGESVSKTISIPSSSSERKNVVVTLRLHYGSFVGGDHFYNEVFFDRMCKKDFSDIRITDSLGNTVKSKILHWGNYEVIRDSRLYVSNSVFVHNGYLYQMQSGVMKRMSADISVKESVSETISTAFVLCFIDSRGFAYFADNNNGKVYIVKTLENISLNDFVEVLDFSTQYVNEIIPTGISLDQNNFAEDSNGYVYIGRYQLEQDVVIFKSVNTTITKSNNKFFDLCYYEPKQGGTIDYNVHNQHVHHICVHQMPDANGNMVDNIVATLDNATRDYGPEIIVSIDGGTTWSNVRIEDNDLWNQQRARDYTLTWLNNKKNLTIVTGEVGILGGSSACIAKVSHDANGKIVIMAIREALKTGHGSRKAFSFDDDFVVHSMNSQGGINNSYQLVYTDDNFKTWKPLYCQYINTDTNASGTGPRWWTSWTMPNGEKTFGGSGINVSGQFSYLRVFKGGDHYFGEMLVFVGDIPANETRTLTIQNNYLVGNQDEQCLAVAENPVARFMLNAGKGDFIYDAEGFPYEISGTHYWYNRNNNMRFGSWFPYQKSGDEGSAIRFSDMASCNVGKVPIPRRKGFSIVVWMLTDTDYISTKQTIISFGDMQVYMQSGKMYIGDNYGKVSCSYRTMVNRGLFVPYLITLSNDATPSMSVQYGDYPANTSGSSELPTNWTYPSLDSVNAVLGGNTKVYINSIAIYDKVLSRDEFLRIWRGGTIL